MKPVILCSPVCPMRVQYVDLAVLLPSFFFNLIKRFDGLLFVHVPLSFFGATTESFLCTLSAQYSVLPVRNSRSCIFIRPKALKGLIAALY